MTAPKRLSGVLAPVVTPFKRDLSPDRERYVRHCKWLLANGCRGLAVFGTNSEANSLSVDERMVLLETLVQEGVPADRLMPGTGCCALIDSVRLTAHATALGCAGVLMLPPFYYKGVSDEGLYRNFAEVIERVGDARLQLYLYHIPPVSQVPISLGLIERLLGKYPGIVAGVKDSSGDWSNTQAMLDNLYRNWRSPDAERQQAAIAATRKIVQKQPMIAALKAAVAHFGNDPQWKTLRPPLIELNP